MRTLDVALEERFQTRVEVKETLIEKRRRRLPDRDHTSEAVLDKFLRIPTLGAVFRMGRVWAKVV
jgi:hypothetical protein